MGIITAIGFGHTPEEKDIRHPEALTHAISRFGVAYSMAGAIVLTDGRPDAGHRRS